MYIDAWNKLTEQEKEQVLEEIKVSQDALKIIQQKLKEPIDKDNGTYNSFCPKCKYRNGHSLVWCYECGNKMVKYDPKIHEITKEVWINSAMTAKNRFDRISYFIYLCQIYKFYDKDKYYESVVKYVNEVLKLLGY